MFFENIPISFPPKLKYIFDNYILECPFCQDEVNLKSLVAIRTIDYIPASARMITWLEPRDDSAIIYFLTK